MSVTQEKLHGAILFAPPWISGWISNAFKYNRFRFQEFDIAIVFLPPSFRSSHASRRSLAAFDAFVMYAG